MHLTFEQRLAAAGITLPEAPAPIGDYVRGISRSDIWYLSGQLPLLDGEVLHPGRLGEELTVDQGRSAARQAACNALSQIKHLLGSSGQFGGLLRLEGLIACTPQFTDHALVLDAASELFTEVLGELGHHARSVAGVTSLPRNAAVELVLTFAGTRCR